MESHDSYCTIHYVTLVKLQLMWRLWLSIFGRDIYVMVSLNGILGKVSLTRNSYLR